MDELKVIERGDCYLTPLKEEHFAQIEVSLSPESLKEITILGYDSTRQALEEMHKNAEAYIVRHKDGDIICVGGLWYGDTTEEPQLFAMFSSRVKEKFTLLARGSKTLVNFFDQTQPTMCMSILAEHEAMLNWAAWLGFEPVAYVDFGDHQYVDFVRCNPKQKNVYDTARPVKH